MKLVKANPFYTHQGVDRLFNELLTDRMNCDRYERNELMFNPSANIYETDDSYRIDLTVPGFEKEQIKLTVENDLLVVKGEFENKENEYKYSRVEFNPQNFEKTFRLSEKIDQQKIEAAFKNGILHITLSKKEESIPVKRQIEVV